MYLPRSRRNQLAEDRDRPDHQSPGAQSLQRAELDQLRHRLRQAGQRRPGQENHDRGQEQLLAAIKVAELAVQRGGHGRREHVRGHHPGQVRDAAEVADDARQRRADDQLVQHGEQNREQQPRQHDLDLPPEGGGLVVRCRYRCRLCCCHQSGSSNRAAWPG
jgi:hypothetical protein